MPRWVMSSPIHMTSTQPAVSEMTMRKTRGALKFSMTGSPALRLEGAEEEDVADRLARTRGRR